MQRKVEVRAGQICKHIPISGLSGTRGSRAAEERMPEAPVQGRFPLDEQWGQPWVFGWPMTVLLIPRPFSLLPLTFCLFLRSLNNKSKVQGSAEYFCKDQLTWVIRKVCLSDFSVSPPLSHFLPKQTMMKPPPKTSAEWWWECCLAVPQTG